MHEVAAAEVASCDSYGVSSASQSERLAFGPNLRRARLRRGVSLESISSDTNVPVALWEGFEGDRRRSTTLRQLASTLDQPTVWTDDWPAERERRADCRAAHAQQLHERRRARRGRIARAAVDLAFIAAIASATATVFRRPVATETLAIGLVYYAVSEITGRSMGRWTVKRAAASSFWLRSEKA